MPNISDKFKSDYKNIEFKNPRLQRAEEGRKRLGRRLLKIGMVLFFLWLGYMFGWSDFFSISDVRINGFNRINQDKFWAIVNNYRQERTGYLWQRNNYWAFNTEELRSRIENQYWLESLLIKKSLPNHLLIEFREKQAALNWRVGDDCFELDPAGVAIAHCDEGATDKLVINDLSGSALTIGTEAVSREGLAYFIVLEKMLAQNFSGIFTPAQYQKRANLVEIETREGPVLQLDMNFSAPDQLNRLSILLQQAPELKSSLTAYSYFNLRFGDKIYYK